MSQIGIYSEMKPAWWFVTEGDVPESPKQVQLILSDLCNQDCSFCAYRMSGYSSNQLFIGESEKASFGHNNPRRMIDTPRAKALISELSNAGVLGVQFTGGGEPTVHPDHESLFLQTLNLGMKAALVSNGLRWSERLTTEILPYFSWVRVSIDAGNKASYAKIRRVPENHWDKVWENVHTFSAALRVKKSQCAFGLGFVVTPENYEEILSFTYLAAESGADNIRFTAMFNPDDAEPYEKCYQEITDLIAIARKQYNRRDFTVHDNFGSRIGDLRQHAPDYSFCGYQYYTTYIGGDLQAYRCCVLAYNERGKIAGGNLKETTFEKFWSGKARQYDMANFNAKECERCQFNEKNRAINYLLQLEPPHKEFP